MSTLIEKLEKERNAKSSLADYYKTVALEQFVGGLEKAIAIVKQHKCTWQGTFSKAEETIHYTLSCGNKYFDNCLGADVECFKYCPFCGGEIEFSEVQP